MRRLGHCEMSPWSADRIVYTVGLLYRCGLSELTERLDGSSSK